MKSRTYYYCLAIGAMAAGCGTSSTDSVRAPASDNGSGTAASTQPATSSGGAADNAIPLTPANTTVEFIGNHTGDDPKPRRGSFEDFAGSAVVDGGLKSVSVEIVTSSLTTEIDKLTNHLKNADFFDVNQFPTASFQSTEIKASEDGSVQITGDLTLLGQTRSVSFPATVDIEDGLDLKAEFEIDRTKWGMDYGPDQIEKQVPMSITIAE